MAALYAFAKLVDDWGDSQASTSHSNQAIDWHQWINACCEPANDSSQRETFPIGNIPSDCRTIQLALSDTILRFAIPPQYLHEIVDGVTFDLTNPFSIADREQLDRYCYLVASAVGLACLSIWDGNQPEVHPAAIDCGRAFQLTNILRDVKEDRDRGRIYVPLDLLAAHDVDLELWRQGKPSGDWKSALQTMVEWARTGYRSGWRVQAALDSDGQRMFSLMWQTYHRLLERIASDLDAVWVRRVRLTRLEKTTLYLQHALTPCYRRRSTRGEIDE
jgi:phytoene synthase